MATTVRVEVKGLRELGAQLKALSKDMQTKVSRAAVSAGAKIIKDRAIQIVNEIPAISDASQTPEVPPGYMRDSIIMRRQRRPDRRLTVQYAVTLRYKGAKAKLRKVGKDGKQVTPYQIGVFNEFGTVNMSAQPFMRPAFDQRKRDALEAIRKRLKKRIDRANKAK